MKEINIIIPIRNVIIFCGAIVAAVVIVLVVCNWSHSATISYADPNQKVEAVQRDVKYSYDSFAKTEIITSINKLKNEIAELERNIKSIKEGAASQILGMQQERQKKIDLIKSIKDTLQITEVSP